MLALLRWNEQKRAKAGGDGILERSLIAFSGVAQGLCAGASEL
jgi:hypothetical protein